MDNQFRSQASDGGCLVSSYRTQLWSRRRKNTGAQNPSFCSQRIRLPSACSLAETETTQTRNVQAAVRTFWLFREVVRGGVEPPTFRFSGGRSYQLSYLTI